MGERKCARNITRKVKTVPGLPDTSKSHCWGNWGPKSRLVRKHRLRALNIIFRENTITHLFKHTETHTHIHKHTRTHTRTHTCNASQAISKLYTYKQIVHEFIVRFFCKRTAFGFTKGLLPSPGCQQRERHRGFQGLTWCHACGNAWGHAQENVITLLLIAKSPPLAHSHSLSLGRWAPRLVVWTLIYTSLIWEL